MNIMMKPYGTAMGMSLLIHSVLIGILVVLGQMIEPVSYATPIEVTLVPASVVDSGRTLTDFNPPALDSRAVTKPSAAISSKPLQKQVLPKEDALVQQQQTSLANTQIQDAAPIQTPVTGVAVNSSNSVNDHSDQPNMEKTNGEQPVKPLIKTKASHLSGGRPAYPSEARHAGWEGTVVIRILVGIDGEPLTVSVSNSSGYRVLDEAATQAIKKWRFYPACQGENPIESYYDVRVKFNLDDE